jgi:hypothetical protein
VQFQRRVLRFFAVLFCGLAEPAFGSMWLCNETADAVLPVDTTALLNAHRAAQSYVHGVKVQFAGVDGHDVYNPTKPFRIGGKTVIAGRVERRTSEASEVVFFEEHAGVWSPVPGAPVLKMQDPFVSVVKGEHVIGGVETVEVPGGGRNYRTVFFRGDSLTGLRRFAEGPWKMKDIRLVELEGGIGLFTRPQGRIEGTDIDGGPGRIGFTVIDSLERLTPEVISRAPLLKTKFNVREWTGVNEAIVLENGHIGALSHIAKWHADGTRGYYPMSFKVDPVTGRSYDFRILLERSQLPGGLAGEAKRPDLVDVLFSGGLVRHGDGKATLYVGAGDAEVYAVEIDDPFWLH